MSWKRYDLEMRIIYGMNVKCKTSNKNYKGTNIHTFIDEMEQSRDISEIDNYILGGAL